MRLLKMSLPLLFAFGVMVINGCTTAGTKGGMVSDIKKMFGGTYTVDPYMEKHIPKTVAVLPFIDESRSQKGNEIVRRGFYNHFSSLPFKDMELYQVDHLLRKAGYNDPETLSHIPPEKLKDMLNVDAVIMGSISNFDKLFAGIYSQVSVGAEIKMIDTTGQFLWSGKHVVRIYEASLPTSPIGVITSIISAAMNVRDIQLLRACDDLFRDMIKTIPVTSLAQAQAQIPPVIDLLIQDSQGLPKKTGDEIRVFLKGSPGLTSWFDIGDFKKGIDMQEVEPGGYVGTYRVIPGDNIENAIISGYLDSGMGNPTRWVDALGTITIDTQPPEPPQNIIAIGRENSVTVSWDENKEKDLSGYILYKSETPLSGFVNIDQTEFTHFEDRQATNLKTYYYKVSAIDRAGNESEQKSIVPGTAVPAGPTPVSGTIDQHTTWYAGASPYIIEDTVIVSQNAILTIEPGTRIKSNGSGIMIKGGILAKGLEKQIITFESNTEKSWKGIAFQQAKGSESIMAFVRISGAAVGVDCHSSSPVLKNDEWVNNQIGLRISGGYAIPQIEANLIHQQNGAAVVINDGAAPKVTANHIQNNRKEGLIIEKAGSVLLKNNRIVNNAGTGIRIKDSSVKIIENDIYDNHPYNIAGDDQGKAIDADRNWWGSANWREVFDHVRGRIYFENILDNSFSKSNPIPVPVLKAPIDITISKDSIFTLSNSPYKVAKDLIIDQGATLFIQTGVQILFDKQTLIVVKDGGIVAKGDPMSPIVFTSSSISPSPGDYMNSVRFSEKTSVSSFFRYCIFRYATTALDIQYGMPEITYSYIADNSQSGIRCGNDAAPRILYNTIARNLGSGGIECVGMAKPVINHNNFEGNSVAIQAFSTIFIDARYNFWGKVPPDKGLIFGENINFESWLEKPEKTAFCPGCNP